jgi:hypothetical protein
MLFSYLPLSLFFDQLLSTMTNVVVLVEAVLHDRTCSAKVAEWCVWRPFSFFFFFFFFLTKHLHYQPVYDPLIRLWHFFELFFFKKKSQSGWPVPTQLLIGLHSGCTPTRQVDTNPTHQLELPSLVIRQCEI